jgi:putative sugar O-methyltransferase
MRLGPIAVLKSTTLDKLIETQDFLNEQNAKLSVELGAGSTLHSFMHYPWTAQTAAQAILDPDKDIERARRAIERIISAFKISQDENQALTGSSMWDEIGNRHSGVIAMIAAADVDSLVPLFTQLFQSELIWGLGKFDNNLVEDMKRVPDKSHVQLRITDALISLAQASAAYGVTNVEQQGTRGHLNALDTNLENIFRATREKTGLELSSPEVGASYGCRIDGQFVTIDGFLHSYSLLRLKQLEAQTDGLIAEIGGGFGALAQLAVRAGYRKYRIYDLPWVNAIQAYYLLMSLPENSVRLHGEPKHDKQFVEVLPYWEFERVPPESLDFVINCDSLPEMSSDTCASYLKAIARTLKGVFISINQEAKSPNANGGNQNSVPEMVDSLGKLKRISRSLYWMRQGYVEEIYVPAKEVQEKQK